MQLGTPDPEPAPPPSLAQRLSAHAKRRPAAGAQSSGGAWPEGSIAALVALLIILGALLTIGGARLLAAQQRAATARLDADAAPRIEAARAAAEARGQIDAVLRRMSLGATLEALARALPADATLIRAARTGEGVLEIDVAASDPDQLRAALRRTPALARLRNTGQRQAEGRMIVTFVGTTQ
jgi:hypothetical protein